MSIMNDGMPLCDGPCNTIYPPSGLIELWPREIHGPYGPQRWVDQGFHLCLDCLRQIVSSDRASQLRCTEQAQRLPLAVARSYFHRAAA
jgi:hypothetical protein